MTVSAYRDGELFWILKHGIKMTGMAAWGPTHNDNLIWNMVAFLRKLPGLSAAQYQIDYAKSLAVTAADVKRVSLLLDQLAPGHLVVCKSPEIASQVRSSVFLQVMILWAHLFGELRGRETELRV